MRAGSIALAVVFAVCLASPSQAKTHRYGYCGHSLQDDYNHSNSLSPLSYIYPAANWGPFFKCHLYRSRVVYLPGAY
jgi:hypothetical protein